MGKPSRDKGGRIEREIVNKHRAIGIHAERVPLSGASVYQGNGSDVDVYPWGRNGPPLVCEVKSRESGSGFRTIERWLGDSDLMFLRRDRAEPFIVMPWTTWARMLNMRGIK